jgi:hypothetical protein
MNSARRIVRRRVISQMMMGAGVVSIPIGLWWFRAKQERCAIENDIRTRVRIPNIESSDDRLISICRPGDVLVFDRRCEKCAAGPWSALACLVQRYCIAGSNMNSGQNNTRSYQGGAFDHIGLIVPGYIRSKSDAYDSCNLLVLEATPSGIVTRDIRTRLEMTQSRSVLLLRLCSPGEHRDMDPELDDDTQQYPTVIRTRRYVEGQLMKFRDRWTVLGLENHYAWMHSTLSIGGAILYQFGLHKYVNGPVSPAAYLVLMGLQYAAVAENIDAKHNRAVTVEDFLHDYRYEDENAVRLRAGWRYLPPIPLRETAR